ncbi:MAG: hypothetical protein EP332_09575 [Bacteroidetes bacterium]|nr:MAG: hypothetical protein EP332_09575 [Bacteroidota bacterium]
MTIRVGRPTANAKPATALRSLPFALSPSLSALSSLLSALRSPPSALRPQLSALSSPPSALRPQLSALSSPPSALRPQLSALSSLLSALRPQLSALPFRLLLMPYDNPFAGHHICVEVESDMFLTVYHQHGHGIGRYTTKVMGEEEYFIFAFC